VIPLRQAVLCADDYGLTAGVSRGILQLAEAGRISATSCMSSMGDWRRAAPDLRAFDGRIGIGLHLNLTTGAPLGKMPLFAPDGSFPSVSDLIQRAYTGRLPGPEIEAEIARQLEAFEDAFGRAPDFVDGHQHVHVLPVIRHALIDVLRRRELAGKIWLRDPSEAVVPIVRREVSANKALVVKALAIGFRRSAEAAGFRTNEGFSGFAPFDGSATPELIFRRAFRDLGPRALVMCHPGEIDADLWGLDPAVESRPEELRHLLSPAFANLLSKRGITLVPAP
jgi:chitin disaccharide deacetylase